MEFSYANETKDKSIKVKFDSLYQQFCESANRDLDEKGLSTIGRESGKYIGEIVKLGIPALPYIIEKMEKGNFFLTLPFYILTKKKFEKSEWPEHGGSKAAAQMCIQWWKEGRKEIPQRFDNLYTDWNSLKQSGKTAEAEEIYKKIVRLGIIVLPYLVEKISEGDTVLIPAVSKLTNGELKEDTKPEECMDWWNKNKEKWYIPIEDEPIEREETKEEEKKE